MDDDHPVPLAGRFVLALGLQYNVIFLIGAVSFALALASPLPLEIAGAVEVLWLLIALVFSGVARGIKTHNQRADAVADEASGANHQDLDAGYRSRGAVLRHVNERIRDAGRANRGVSRGDLRAAMNRLETIRQTFLRFAGTHQRLSRFLIGLQTADIDGEVARVTDALYVEKDPTVKMGLRQALALAQRRLQQREQLVNTLRGIEVQMSTIENAFAYIESIAPNASTGRDIEAEIDALVARISPADVLDVEAGSVLSVGPPTMRQVAG